VPASAGACTTPEGEAVRAVIGMQPHTGARDVDCDLHLLIPKAVPQSPDLGADYSPN